MNAACKPCTAGIADDIRIMKAIFPHQQVIVGDIKVETILVANLISFKARTIRLGTQRISNKHKVSMEVKKSL